jgi:hypothetical protein
VYMVELSLKRIWMGGSSRKRRNGAWVESVCACAAMLKTMRLIKKIWRIRKETEKTGFSGLRKVKRISFFELQYPDDHFSLSTNFTQCQSHCDKVLMEHQFLMRRRPMPRLLIYENDFTRRSWMKLASKKQILIDKTVRLILTHFLRLLKKFKLVMTVYIIMDGNSIYLV